MLLTAANDQPYGFLKVRGVDLAREVELMAGAGLVEASSPVREPAHPLALPEQVTFGSFNNLAKLSERVLDAYRAPQPLDIRLVTIESLGKLKETSALPRLSDVLRKDPEAAEARHGLGHALAGDGVHVRRDDRMRAPGEIRRRAFA